MREDFEENISRMFPRGYVVVYILSNGDIRCNAFNPEGFAQINKIRELIESEEI
jgi:hypothetical protein